MKRKYVQKPTNISKSICKIYKKKKWRYWLILNKDYLLSNPKKFDVHFEQTHTKPQKGTEFKLNVPIQILSSLNHLNVEERKWIIGCTSIERLLFILWKQNRNIHNCEEDFLETSSTYEQSKNKDINQNNMNLNERLKFFDLRNYINYRINFLQYGKAMFNV